jgi:hypothetical protein
MVERLGRFARYLRLTRLAQLCDRDLARKRYAPDIVLVPSTFADDLREALYAGEFSDFAFKSASMSCDAVFEPNAPTQARYIPAHKCVLFARSEYFKCWFESAYVVCHMLGLLACNARGVDTYMFGVVWCVASTTRR